jgi:hypothetical protein
MIVSGPNGVVPLKGPDMWMVDVRPEQFSDLPDMA